MTFPPSPPATDLQMGNQRHEIGERAERVVSDWLAGRGWTVLARRWRSPAGELDLVCVDTERRLVGVEVRFRRSARSGSAVESVTARHRARLRAALVAFALAHRVAHRGLRTDLVAVTPDGDRLRLARHPGIDAW